MLFILQMKRARNTQVNDHNALLKELSKKYEDDKKAKYLEIYEHLSMKPAMMLMTKIREDLIKHYKIRV